MSVFSERLKLCRENRKENNSSWTQGYVADKIEVARTTYTAYENGTKSPTLETLNRIADLFGVSIDYLLGRSDYNEELRMSTNNHSLQKWYIELSQSNEEDLLVLKGIWEVLNNSGKLQ